VSTTDGSRIGVDLGGTKIEAVLMDPAGEILRRERVPTPRHDYRKTIETIHELVRQFERDLGAPATVGIGTPGAISPATGLIKNANSVWLNGMPLLRDLQRELGREVRMANDADCFALSEAIDGAGRDAEIVFGVILGTGVGGGLVHGRRLLSGPNAIAGEWGHNALPWWLDSERPGPDCYCGLTGCIETFVSGPGLERDYSAVVGASLSSAEIAMAADEGDAQADAALQRYEQRLSRALASVINVVDPHVIVLGGGLSRISRLYESVPTLWGTFVFSDRVDTRLVPPVHGDSGGVRGAAWLW
jgi:fructokinase